MTDGDFIEFRHDKSAVLATFFKVVVVAFYICCGGRDMRWQDFSEKG